jgi:hypothetical protein
VVVASCSMHSFGIPIRVTTKSFYRIRSGSSWHKAQTHNLVEKLLWTGRITNH